MSGYDDLNVTVNDSRATSQAQDPRTLARLQDDARVEQAGKLLDWGKTNLSRFDVTGDSRVNLGEIDMGLRTTRNNEDRDMLALMADQFPQLKGRKDAISVGDLQKHFDNETKLAQQNEMARRQQAYNEQLQAGSRDLMKPLLETPDGNPNGSLFRVLDTMRDRKPDDEISKRDLQRYMDDYQRRVRTGDEGSAQFNPQTRQYVQNLLDNWDSPEIKRLRGTWRDSDNHEHANGSISAKSLREAGGLSGQDSVYQPFLNASLQRQEAPTVKSKMVVEMIPSTHVSKFESDPRLADRQARDAETQRIADAQGLRDWGKNNLARYDITGDKAVNYGEVDMGLRTTRNPENLDRLSQLQGNWGQIHDGGKVRQRDLDKYVMAAQRTFETNEASRQAQFMMDRNSAQTKDMIAPMFATTTGHPNESLFKVLDGIRGNVDNKVGEKDLKKFAEEYDWRSRNGDVGTGHYTPQNRAYVQNLLDNWNSPDVIRMRGTWTAQDNFGRGNSGRTREIPNKYITADSLRAATQMNDLYASYVRPEDR